MKKIFEVDTHVACAISGLTADARTLVDHARVEAVNHTFVYNEKIKVAILHCTASVGQHGTQRSTLFACHAGVSSLTPRSQVASLAQSVCDLALSFGEGGDEAETKMVGARTKASLCSPSNLTSRPCPLHTEPTIWCCSLAWRL